MNEEAFAALRRAVIEEYEHKTRGIKRNSGSVRRFFYGVMAVSAYDVLAGVEPAIVKQLPSSWRAFLHAELPQKDDFEKCITDSVGAELTAMLRSEFGDYKREPA